MWYKYIFVRVKFALCLNAWLCVVILDCYSMFTWQMNIVLHLLVL